MKEPFVSSCIGIGGVGLIGFEYVAKAAGQPKIVFFVGTAAGSWQDVFDLKPAENESLRSEAIPATIARLETDAVTNDFFC